MFTGQVPLDKQRVIAASLPLLRKIQHMPNRLASFNNARTRQHNATCLGNGYWQRAHSTLHCDQV